MFLTLYRMSISDIPFQCPRYCYHASEQSAIDLATRLCTQFAQKCILTKENIQKAFYDNRRVYYFSSEKNYNTKERRVVENSIYVTPEKQHKDCIYMYINFSIEEELSFITHTKKEIIVDNEKYTRNEKKIEIVQPMTILVDSSGEPITFRFSAGTITRQIYQIEGIYSVNDLIGSLSDDDPSAR